MAPALLTQLCWVMPQAEPLGSKSSQPLDGFVLSGGGCVSLGLEEALSRAVTMLLLADLQDNQHAGSLVRGREGLPSFSGACFQDP